MLEMPFKSSGWQNYSVETPNMMLAPSQADPGSLQNSFVANLSMSIVCLGEIFQVIFTWSTYTEYARMSSVEWEPISQKRLSPVLERHWGHCHLCSISMTRKNLCNLVVPFEVYPGSEKDRNMIIQQLQNSKVFSTTPGSKHPTFLHPRDVLHSKKSELLKWIIEHL